MMPPIIWIGVAIATAFALDRGAKAVDETGQALDSATGLTKYAIAGGALYVAYRAAQSSGAIK